jgi:hypothetical protein
MSTVTVQKRKAGRPKILETKIEFKVPWADSFFIAARAAYEKRDVAEFMRMMVNDDRKRYRRSREFKGWLERHKEELAKMGINVEQIW